MSWALAIAALIALIVLHELGHFLAAKAVGMRVERFSLFFGPVLWAKRRGETEFVVSAIPLGGYVRITGQNPREEIPPELAQRSYFAQPPWRRIVVVAAGPLANVVVAVFLAWFAFLAFGIFDATHTVARDHLAQPAASVLRPGDRLVSVDDRTGSPSLLSRQIGRHRCSGPLTSGCPAATPVKLVVERHHQLLTIFIRPRYDATLRRMRLGFTYQERKHSVGPVSALTLSTDRLWAVTKANVTALIHIFEPQQRQKLSGVVGVVDITQQVIRQGAQQTLFVVALISLALAIVNLLPILPLDGGHLLWTIIEKVRGRAVPVTVMERVAMVGILLILMIFFIGLSNDITQLHNGRLRVR